MTDVVQPEQGAALESQTGTQGPWQVGKWLGRGRCLAENEASGRMLAVGGTLPGERVLVEVERTRWKTWGNATAVLSPAPARVVPRCPHVGSCPGCVMLHVSEGAEDDYKATVVSEVFQRIFDEASLSTSVPLPSDIGIVAPTRRGGQRVRATLSWRVRNGRCEVGLRRFDGAIAHAPECDANAADVRAICEAFSQRWPHLHPRAQEGAIDVSVGSHGMARVWLTRDPGETGQAAPALAESLAAALPAGTSVELALGDPRKPHERTVLARLGDEPSGAPIAGIALAPSALGWTQPTPVQASRVYEWVVDQLDATGANVLDVGSATGGLSLAIGASSSSVLGIDVDYRAVQAATASAALRDAHHVTFRGGKAETVLPKLAQSTPSGHYTRALVNPFRSPLGEDAMQALVTLGVERIVYLAPSPTSGAKDAVHLVRAGFALESLGVASLHPGTAQGMACTVFQRA